MNEDEKKDDKSLDLEIKDVEDEEIKEDEEIIEIDEIQQIPYGNGQIDEQEKIIRNVLTNSNLNNQSAIWMTNH